MEHQEADRVPGWVRWALALLLLVALVVRVWYGAIGLNQSRFFDERYTYENVDSLLRGELQPANGWYPSLSYLPPTLVAFAVDRIAGALSPDTWRLKRQGVFSPAIILACRILQAVYGTVSIWLVYLIGRRLFDPATGLAAAFLLSVVPGHVRLSAVVKPDILMIAFLLLVILVSLRLIDGIGWRRVLLAGVLVGLTTAAKQYGVVAAIPVGVAILFSGQSWARRLFLFGSAMAAGAAVFLATNPWIGLLIHYANRNRRLYGQQGGGRAEVLTGAFRLPLSETGHGFLLGSAALVGIFVLALIAVRRATPMASRKGISLILITLVGYVAFCVAFLPWSKYNLWITITPLTSITLAFATVAAIRRLRAVGGVLARVTPVLGLVALGLGASPGLAALYQDRVPTTQARVEQQLRARWRNVNQRLVYQERSLESLLARSYWADQFILANVEALPGLRERSLDYADAEVFAATRLAEPNGELYRRRMAAYEDLVLRVEPRWFRARGEELVVVDHGWRRVGRPIDLELQPGAAEEEFSGVLPSPGRRRGYASLELWLPMGSDPEGAVRVGDSRLRLYAGRSRPGYTLYLTQRVRLPARTEQPVTVRLPATEEQEEPTFAIRLHRWDRMVTKNVPEEPES